MNLTVNQLLTVVGRLDDSPGFDTPRERFRRFLNERMTDAHSARLVLQECRSMAGEQNHRALQDALVLTGKLLGFLTRFGRYRHDPGTAPIAGHWESRRRLRVTLSLCGSLSPPVDLDALSKAARDASDPRDTAETPRLGLCVVTAFYAARPRLEEMLRMRTHPELRLMSLDGILRLADMVAAGQLTHDDVLQVLNPDVNVDTFLNLLDRWATATPPVSERALEAAPAAPVPAASALAAAVSAPAPAVEAPQIDSYWIAAIRLAPDIPPPRFVDSVIAGRKLLAVNPAAQVQRPVQPGDAICVCIIGAGFVADARVEGIVTEGSVVRDSERYAQVLRLSDVTIYDAPVIPAPDLIRRLELRLDTNAGAVVSPLSRQEFEFVTRAAAAGTA